MKQEEKTKRTRERILEAALTEFGTKRYEAASISSICSKNHLSKGLLYHNFGSKDELYLYCVRYVYDRTLEYGAGAESRRADAEGQAGIFS